MKYLLTGGSALLFSAAAFTFACSSDDSFSSENDDASGGASNKPDVDGQVGGASGSRGSDSEPDGLCEPNSKDSPDDDFFDANCDGIDGDLENAVFVSPAGDDLGAGTSKDPVATINAGIALAQKSGKDVYVCNGSYDRQIRMENTAVNIYGGYDCENDWRRVPDRAVIEVALGIPLSLKNVQNVTIERLVFRAPDTSEIGASSIAAAISESTGVVLRRVELEAGNAGPGEDGEPGRTHSTAARKGGDGSSGCLGLGCSPPGQGGTSTSATSCVGGEMSERGGYGGDGASSSGTPGFEKGFSSPTHGTPGGQTSKADGSDGKAGAKAAPGAVSERPLGDFEGPNYLPINGGAAGGYGTDGHAGGGGAGTSPGYQGDLCCIAGRGGSQGGSGGCAGYPAGESQGGGGSFAIVIDRSDVELVWARLLTGEGGDGGAGAEGGAGQEGGAPGAPGSQGNWVGGTGGRGGKGGAGADSAPGGGGPSLAIAIVDSEVPKLEEVQILLGNPGFSGAPVSGPRAADGIAADGYDFGTEQVLTF